MWRYNDNREELWKQLVDTRYGRNEFWTPGAISVLSRIGVWTQIIKLWPEFQKFIALKVGDGSRIWTDVWLGEEKLMNRFPTLYSLISNKNCTIADCYTGQEWKFNFRRNFNDWEVDEIGQLLYFFGTCDPRC